MTTRTAAVAIGLAGALTALAALPVAGQALRYSGSVGYASGSYTFAERTASVAIVNGLSLSGDRWSLSASIPLVLQEGETVSYVGGTRIPTGGRTGTGVRRPGMSETAEYSVGVGDPLFRGSVTPYQGLGFLRSVEVQAMVKAPVADSSTGVGTGAWDVGGGASAGLGIGRSYLFVDAAVWSPGDMPDLDLREYVTLSVGVGRPLTDRWSVLASASFATPMIDGLAPPASLGGGVSRRIGDGASMNAGAGIGLTESAPDVSVYVGWSAGL